MKVIREFAPADRYVYDFGVCSSGNNFAQIDTEQDASYFGTWADPERLIIVTYAEGDVITNICDDAEEFKKEVLEIKKWNEENGWKFYGIDPGFNKDLAESFKAIGLGDLLH